MCDYSLEMYRSRPAEEGVKYETHRFPSHSIGFVEPGDTRTAVCMSCGTTLQIDNVPADLQRELAVSARETVTFTRIETGMHHDGIHFANGAEITLQRLGEGVKAVVVDALTGTHVHEHPEAEPARERLVPEPAE